MKRKKALEKLARLAIKSSDTIAKTKMVAKMDAHSVSLSCTDYGDSYYVTIYIHGKDEFGLMEIIEDVVVVIKKEEITWS